MTPPSDTTFGREGSGREGSGREGSGREGFGREGFAREVLDTPVVEEMTTSFLAYSLSVITSRAIPDVRDGLKPVQRRILYAMLDGGLRPANPYKKSAHPVGEVMSRFHPHGDGAIYEALVRLAQPFSMRLPLVDPKGNFGTLDDPPAAHRYTECRLAQPAMEMVEEIDEDTVDFRPTYDSQNVEPVYLPSRLPNLLVNGSAGIAVGMATNLAPHNLGEVCAALRLLLAEPDATLRQVMRRLPAPDFPTGGLLVDDGGVLDAYRTGRGTFRLRARAEVTDVSARRRGIVVSELPYGVGVERVKDKLKELLAAGRVGGITDVADLSDRHHGLRLQIEVRSGVDPHAVLAELYRLTPLEETFAVNNVVLVDGRPTTLGLVDLCRHFLDHRLDVVVRRSRYRLAKRRDREHIVVGLLIALDAIDEVVRLIRASADTPGARDALMARFGLSEVQATHILDMALRRLTSLEVTKLRDELESLRAEIADLDDILARDERRRGIVGDELAAMADAHGSGRRTTLLGAEEALVERPESLEISDDPCTVTLSTSGLVGRVAADDDRSVKPGRHDVLAATAPATVRGRLWAITSAGRGLPIEAVEVPEVAGRSRGAAAGEVFDLTRGERVVGLYGGADAADDRLLVLVTAQGVVKRLSPDEMGDQRGPGDVIGLRDDDRVVAALALPDGAEVMMVASDGQTLRTATDQVRPQGRAAGGMAGIKLRSGARVVAAHAIHDTDVVVTWTDQGALTVASAAEFPARGRATGGIRAMRLRAGESEVVGAWVGPFEVARLVVGKGEGLFARADPEPRPLDVAPRRRDATGVALDAPVLAVGGGRAR